MNTAVFGSDYICFNSTSGRYVKVEAGNAAPTPPQLTDAYGYTIVCLGSCSTPTPTPTYTPTPTSVCPFPIFTHGALLQTCSDYCNINYLIQTTDCASANYFSLSIGDFIYGYSGQTGYLAYSSVSTDTNTGPFKIADID